VAAQSGSGFQPLRGGWKPPPLFGHSPQKYNFLRDQVEVKVEVVTKEDRMKPTLYSKNMKLLRARMGILAKAIEVAGPSPFTYLTELSKKGSMTLAIKTAEKVYQIHSKYDPVKEAMQQVAGQNFRNPRIILVLGLGLGFHLRSCLREFKDTNHFIILIERDIQALKAAMEAVDITDLLGSDKIRWVIGVPESEGYAVLHEMIKQAGIGLQLFLKTLVIFEHPALAQVHGDYFRSMVRSFREAAHTVIFNYGNCPKDSMIGVENIMANLSTIIRNPGVKDLFGAFKGVPGLVVSTGPSLDKNILDLKSAEGRCVMVSADSAFKVLMSKGIKPHAVSTLERIIGVAGLFSPLPTEWMKDVWLAGTPVILPEVYKVWKGPTMMVYRNFAHFEWLQMPKGTLSIGPSCSNMAFKILEALGCDPIILVGQDCSFKNPEKTHAEGASAITNLSLKQEQLFQVKGNVEEFVYTNTIFDLFRKTFVTDLSGFKGTCINCTEGGAFIEGTEVMPLRDALVKYCTKAVDTWGIFRKMLHFPTPKEIKVEWMRFRQTMDSTRREVSEVIKFCQTGAKLVDEFEEELDRGGFNSLDDFLARFPEDRLNKVHDEMTRQRGRIILFGKYFNLYLMHIVQMIIVKFEMDFNELPSLSEEPKRCKLQAVKMMKHWFPTIGDVCRLSLNLLEKAYDKLTAEFGSD